MVKHIMQGLKPEEVIPYCTSRLKLAGLHEEIFSIQALDAIYTITTVFRSFNPRARTGRDCRTNAQGSC
jgi:hypothetical protein